MGKEAGEVGGLGMEDDSEGVATADVLMGGCGGETQASYIEVGMW